MSGIIFWLACDNQVENPSQLRDSLRAIAIDNFETCGRPLRLTRSVQRPNLHGLPDILKQTTGRLGIAIIKHSVCANSVAHGWHGTGERRQFENSLQLNVPAKMEANNMSIVALRDEKRSLYRAPRLRQIVDRHKYCFDRHGLTLALIS